VSPAALQVAFASSIAVKGRYISSNFILNLEDISVKLFLAIFFSKQKFLGGLRGFFAYFRKKGRPSNVFIATFTPFWGNSRYQVPNPKKSSEVPDQRFQFIYSYQP
jgi:hypothetical protein